MKWPKEIYFKLKKFQPEVKEEFSGSSPPEIFVGRYGYPKVYAGVLAPPEYGETEFLAMPEAWHAKHASLMNILSYRARMVYSRFKTSPNKVRAKDKLLSLMQELALSSKAVDASFKLKNKPVSKFFFSRHLPLIGNPAVLRQLSLESNPKVKPKVDYIVADTDVKASEAINELYHAGIPVSHIIKLVSAGVLGLKIQRKLVPTRWAVTATDSIISKALLDRIKRYQLISTCLLFNSNYLGNYYEILFIPRQWSFEVIEWKEFHRGVWHDYEDYFGRKSYASSVEGAYYACRLAVCEWLEKAKRQASVLVLREIRKEYWAPCGVGILRETVREALRKKPEQFDSVEEALQTAQQRLKLPIKTFTLKSKLLNELKKQLSLKNFL